MGSSFSKCGFTWRIEILHALGTKLGWLSLFIDNFLDKNCHPICTVLLTAPVIEGCNWACNC